MILVAMINLRSQSAAGGFRWPPVGGSGARVAHAKRETTKQAKLSIGRRLGVAVGDADAGQSGLGLDTRTRLRESLRRERRLHQGRVLDILEQTSPARMSKH